MIDFNEIQKNIDKAFEEFLIQMLRLNDDRLKYYYWSEEFFETVGNLSFRYFPLTLEQKEFANTIIGKSHFEDSEISFEVNKNSHRNDLKINNIHKLFSVSNKAGQQNRYEYLKEFVFWEVLQIGATVDAAQIPLKIVEIQKRNFLLTYVKYLVENTEKPTFEVLKQYRKYTSTNQGEILEKKLKELEEKGIDNSRLITKINQLYILREDEAKIHFVFSRVGGEEKEELRELLDVMGRKETGNLYRGQASSTWKLDSSLTREPKYLASEANMYYDILSLKPDAFENDHSIYERLITMQHFGMPTRLLDITRNPLVAIFFACNNLPEAKKDGIVFTFSTDKREILNFEDEKLKCLRKLYSKNNWNGDYDEKAADEFLTKVCFIKGVAKNQRINNQSGDFIFVGNGDSISKELRDLPCLSIIIDAPTKKVLLEQLESLNIHGGAVYPDLTHMSNYIRHKYLDREKTKIIELTNSTDSSVSRDKKGSTTEKINISNEDFQKIWDFSTKKEPVVVKQLTSDFDSVSFWSNNRLKKLHTFVEKKKLKNDEAKKIVENIVAFDKTPLPDEIINSMTNKPSLKERSGVVENITEIYLSFAEDLKK